MNSFLAMIKASKKECSMDKILFVFQVAFKIPKKGMENQQKTPLTIPFCQILSLHMGLKNLV